MGRIEGIHITEADSVDKQSILAGKHHNEAEPSAIAEDNPVDEKRTLRRIREFVALSVSRAARSRSARRSRLPWGRSRRPPARPRLDRRPRPRGQEQVAVELGGDSPGGGGCCGRPAAVGNGSDKRSRGYPPNRSRLRG